MMIVWSEYYHSNVAKGVYDKGVQLATILLKHSLVL